MKSQYRCGDCRHFSCERTFDTLCVNLGHLEGSVGCEQFKPNLKKLKTLVEENNGTLEVLGEIISKVPESSLHALSAILYKEKNTRKYGYKFMQKVYVRMHGTGADYVNNFIPAYVIEASKNGLRLLTTKGAEIALLDFTKGELAGPKIFSIKEWRIKKHELLAHKKIDDPSLKRKKVSQEHLLEKKPKSVKEFEINDLVQISRDVERGFVPSKELKREKEKSVYIMGDV